MNESIILYESKLPASIRERFKKRLIEIAFEIGFNPSWAMWIFYHESGLNPKAHNSIGAGGLFGLMPAGWRSMGYGSLDEYLNAGWMAQLETYRKYLLPWKGKIRSVYDLGLINFFPLALSKGMDWAFQTDTLSAKKIRDQNAPIDVNKDGVITKRDYYNYLEGKQKISSKLKDFGGISGGIPGSSFRSSGRWIWIVLGIGAAGFLTYKIVKRWKKKNL